MVIDPTAPLTLGGVAVAVVAMAVGFAGHELFHVGTLGLLGYRPEIEVGIEALVFAAAPPAGTPRWVTALTLLAPLLWTAIGLWALNTVTAGAVLTLPLTPDEGFLVAGFLVGALPSPGDIYTLLLYRPEAGRGEVMPDG